MKIRFGLHLDGQRGHHVCNSIGEATVGPLGLLSILESQMGLPPVTVHPSTRIVQYQACLEACDTPDRFYHRSFATDPVGTAATLLGWRDSWYLHGWNGAVGPAASMRLADMEEVEQRARAEVAACIGQRLTSIASTMARRKQAIARLELQDPLEVFPLRWRDVLGQLPVTVSAPPQPAGTGVLGQLQHALLGAAGGGAGKRVKWEDDGTVTVVRGETGLMASRWVADRVAKSDQDLLLVVPDGADMLDLSLSAAGAARQGTRNASRYRPVLQVLPLALDLLWDPLDCHALIQFLTHPVSPLPSRVRRRLANQLAERPGVCGERWKAVVAEVTAEASERSVEVREAITFWIEHVRYPYATGAPLPVIIGRIERLATYFRGRLAFSEAAGAAAFADGLAQCRHLEKALVAMLGRGVGTIRQQQLHKILASVTGSGSTNPHAYAETGAVLAVSDPVAVIEGVGEVLWWPMAAPARRPPYPWSRGELATLAQSGCALLPVSALLDRAAVDWLRPVMAARKSLVLVLPSKEDEPHPVWQMIEQVVEGLPVKAIEDLLDCPGEGRTAVPHTRLPARRRWWKLAAGSVLKSDRPDSYSSLESYLFNPYQWLLHYPARLRAAPLLSVQPEFRLMGILGHGMVERFVKTGAHLEMLEEEFQVWFGSEFDRQLSEEGAVMLMPGRQAKVEALRAKLRTAITRMRAHWKDAGVVSVSSERALEGTYAGGGLVGHADLVVANANGQHAIIDMKWSGGKNYPTKLRENRHLQLVIYGEMMRQSHSAWPELAYYVLEQGRMLSTTADYFANAQVERGSHGEGAAHLWTRFVATWQWRQQQVANGMFEVVLEGTEADDASGAPEDGMKMEVLNPNYNDYLALAGWEENQ